MTVLLCVFTTHRGQLKYFWEVKYFFPPIAQQISHCSINQISFPPSLKCFSSLPGLKRDTVRWKIEDEQVGRHINASPQSNKTETKGDRERETENEGWIKLEFIHEVIANCWHVSWGLWIPQCEHVLLLSFQDFLKDIYTAIKKSAFIHITREMKYAICRCKGSSLMLKYKRNPAFPGVGSCHLDTALGMIQMNCNCESSELIPWWYPSTPDGTWLNLAAWMKEGN